MKISSHLNLQQPTRVFVVNLAENCVRQINPVNSPTALRRYFRRSVIEIFVFGFKEPEINLIQLVVEDLLRKFVTVRSRVRGEQNPVLVLVEEFARGYRLPPEFADA